ncbi:hypothetical protein KI387_029025, partial [Taxus chinensis]
SNAMQVTHYIGQRMTKDLEHEKDNSLEQLKMIGHQEVGNDAKEWRNELLLGPKVDFPQNGNLLNRFQPFIAHFDQEMDSLNTKMEDEAQNGQGKGDDNFQ